MLACMYSKNLKIIKYLINDLHMDINKKNIYGSNILLKASWHNENVYIIEYLLKDLKMDVKYENIFGNTCTNHIGYKNINVFNYFLENVRVNISELILCNKGLFNETYLIYSTYDKNKKQPKKYKKIHRALFFLNFI